MIFRRVICASISSGPRIQPIRRPPQKSFDSEPIVERCRCSREAVTDMLRNFSREDRRDMVADDGSITVTCEFCNTRYEFAPEEAEALIAE